MQELEKLLTLREEVGDKDGRKEIEEKIQFKSAERDLAASKMVRLRTTTLRQLLYAMKWALVVFSGVCGEQLPTHCLCKGCSVSSVHLH